MLLFYFICFNVIIFFFFVIIIYSAGSVLLSNLEINHISVTTTTIYGGIFFIGGSLTLQDTSFANMSAKQAAFVYVDNCDNADIVNCNFTNGTALGGPGGAVRFFFFFYFFSSFIFFLLFFFLFSFFFFFFFLFYSS
jgi:hypothetical protein